MKRRANEFKRVDIVWAVGGRVGGIIIVGTKKASRDERGDMLRTIPKQLLLSTNDPHPNRQRWDKESK
jgi:hypothetical protein